MKNFIILILLFTSGCGLTQGYSIPSSGCNNNGGLVHGTILTPQGMYSINGIRGNGFSFGSILGPNGMTSYNFME